MEPILLPLFAGLMAAVLHVISGPDHLAAVTPFALESKRSAWRIGMTWGVAHLTGMLLIGLLFMLFRQLIPVEAISAYSEQLVGVVLIAVGAWALYAVFRKSSKHSHLHLHQEEAPFMHKHPHTHTEPVLHGHKHGTIPQHRGLATFSIGFLHGLAGIAHFILFLPVLGFETRTESVAYIVGFGLGTVLAMTVFTLVLGRLSDLAKNWHNPLFFKGVRVAGGLFALLIGVYWLLAN